MWVYDFCYICLFPYLSGKSETQILSFDVFHFMGRYSQIRIHNSIDLLSYIRFTDCFRPWMFYSFLWISLTEFRQEELVMFDNNIIWNCCFDAVYLYKKKEMKKTSIVTLLYTHTLKYKNFEKVHTLLYYLWSQLTKSTVKMSNVKFTY